MSEVLGLVRILMATCVVADLGLAGVYGLIDDLWFTFDQGGISLGGEVSFRPNEPVPITSALPDLSTAILDGASGGTEQGYRREERILGILNAVYVVGPGAPGAFDQRAL